MEWTQNLLKKTIIFKKYFGQVAGSNKFQTRDSICDHLKITKKIIIDLLLNTDFKCNILYYTIIYTIKIITKEQLVKNIVTIFTQRILANIN